MGLLSEGESLSWEQTKELANHVREHGILQFINIYNKVKDRTNDSLRWGDELEYMLVKLDHDNKEAKLVLKASEVLAKLRSREGTRNKEKMAQWFPEFNEYMVEGTPGQPYGHNLKDFAMVEPNMKLRRELLKRSLCCDEIPLSITAFPRAGCPEFTVPAHKPDPSYGSSKSLFFPEKVICQSHPRYENMTRNGRSRRGEKIAINVPVFKDKKTPDSYLDDFSSLGDDGENGRQALPGHIYMDAMAFGFGCCCLQMTFQASNLDEARNLYDQLIPLCPVIMALGAASPLHKGFIADTDHRWDIISQAVDDRTREERGLEPLKENRFRIKKSRYGTVDMYLSQAGEKYNDSDISYDSSTYKQLRDAGIDHLLAQHIAHLFIRDTISLFREKIDQNDAEENDHFENIQSTNWQTLRFKPPPVNSSIGWRVEFRPTDIQLTDFENAAFVVFIALMTRVILSFKLNLLMPISKVDENISLASERDAVLNGKFFFRDHILNEHMKADEQHDEASMDNRSEAIGQYSINEIINGKANGFPGMIPLIKQYLADVDDCDLDTSCALSCYLQLISDRASGKLKTTARFIRDFVSSHPDYKNDSRVSDTINYDLLRLCHEITEGTAKVPDLLPKDPRLLP